MFLLYRILSGITRNKNISHCLHEFISWIIKFEFRVCNSSLLHFPASCHLINRQPATGSIKNKIKSMHQSVNPSVFLVFLAAGEYLLQYIAVAMPWHINSIQSASDFLNICFEHVNFSFLPHSRFSAPVEAAGWGWRIPAAWPLKQRFSPL